MLFNIFNRRVRVCVNICIKKMKIERGVIHDGSFQISRSFKTLHAGCIFKSKFRNFKKQYNDK